MTKEDNTITDAPVNIHWVAGDPSRRSAIWSADPFALCWTLQGGMATMAGIHRPEPEGRLILARSIFPTLTYLNCCSYRHPRSHRGVDAHVRSRSCARTKFSLIAHFHAFQGLCMYEFLNFLEHSRHSALLHNLHRYSCITVGLPSMAHLVCAHSSWHDVLLFRWTTVWKFDRLWVCPECWHNTVPDIEHSFSSVYFFFLSQIVVYPLLYFAAETNNL